MLVLVWWGRTGKEICSERTGGGPSVDSFLNMQSA